jgi:hypothetical protein
MRAEIFTWDWTEPPNLDGIAGAVHKISEGRVVMREVRTGGDNYLWFVADHDVSDKEVLEAYRS